MDDNSRVQRNKARKLKIFLYQHVPISYWLPRYSQADVVPDLIAGISVGLTLIPQSIAYATIAGLEPQYGLYSAFLGSFLYVMLGTVKEITLGPSALSSLRAFKSPQHAVLMCFLVGCLELLCGFLHLTLTKGHTIPCFIINITLNAGLIGFCIMICASLGMSSKTAKERYLVALVSLPVVSGCKSAAAVTIASVQLKGLLGLNFETESLLDTWRWILEHASEARAWDAGLGTACCVVLTALKYLRERTIVSEEAKHIPAGSLYRALWLLTTARNAVVVLGSAIIAFTIESIQGSVPFTLTGRVNAGLPPLQLPPFSAQVGNQTFTFLEMSEELAPSVLVSSVVAILSHIAISKAFMSSKSLDASQELMTLGVCNVAGSLVSSMPVSGSFSRSALSSASGVRTPLAGLYSGILVLLSLSLFTPYFYYIPRATLSAVIICAVMTLIDFRIIRSMWRINIRDVLSWTFTFFSSLFFGTHFGIVTGICVDIACLVYTNAKPRVQIDVATGSCGMEYVVVTPNLGLLFPAVEHLRASIKEASERHDHLDVVLDCRNVYKTDFTVAQNMQSLINEFKTRNCVLVFLNLCPEVFRIFSRVCTSDFYHLESLEDVESIITSVTRGAESVANVTRL